MYLDMICFDAYDNHFLAIGCGRMRFVDFATYTHNAVTAPLRRWLVPEA